MNAVTETVARNLCRASRLRLTLDQLMVFRISEDHARQEQVFEELHHNREPWIIRRDMMASTVTATDRRAVFVGADKTVPEIAGMIATGPTTPLICQAITDVKEDEPDRRWRLKQPP